MLPPGRVEVEGGRIRDIASGLVRNDRDVVADLALIRIAFERIERIARRDISRPRDAAVGAVRIE